MTTSSESLETITEEEYDSQVRKKNISASNREYAEFEFEDATHEEPLLYNQESDEESTLNDSLEQKQYKLPSEGGTIFSSFLNMANSIIGAGIIGLPFAFKEAGFWTGILLLIGITIVVDWTVRLLMHNGKLAGRSTYQDLMEFAFGRPGLIAISIFQFAFAFGGMCAYCVIIGDTIPHVIRSLFPKISQVPIVWIFGDRRMCISFFTLFVSYPLSLYRDISKLAKTSALALVAIIVIIISVVIEGPQQSREIRGDDDQMFNVINDEVFQAIAVISFAFVCHHNSFLIFGSLKQPSLNRFAMVTHWSMGIAFFTCLALAVSGYLVFTDKTVGNILNNFPSDNVLINVARLAFGLNMFTTIPLEAFVCREVIETFYWPAAPFDKIRHFVITSVLILITLIISLLTCNLGIVLELTGGFSATVLAFVLPPMCFLKLATGSIWERGKIPHWLCMLFGTAIMVISTFYSLKKAIYPLPTENTVAEVCN
ncbi:transmembrane amino acid transporter protein-domain-containing protein [Pilaira anomala]|nr:transmembrane amino acid transporter protein-domain-containing protein [Pilaira anomala]